MERRKKINNYFKEKEKKVREDYKKSFYKDNIADKFNMQGNFTLSKKKNENKNSNKISNYKEIRNIIDYITELEMIRIESNEYFIIDDYMLIDNYDNPTKSLNLKVLLKQMFELEKLKLEIKIKYYKKYDPEIKYRERHKLYIDRLQTKLNNTKNKLKSLRIETKKRLNIIKII